MNHFSIKHANLMWSKNQQQGCKKKRRLCFAQRLSQLEAHISLDHIFSPVLKLFVEWTYLSLRKCNFRNLRFPDAGTTGRRCKAHGFVRQKRWIYPQVMAMFWTSNGKTGAAPFFFGGFSWNFRTLWSVTRGDWWCWKTSMIWFHPAGRTTVRRKGRAEGRWFARQVEFDLRNVRETSSSSYCWGCNIIFFSLHSFLFVHFLLGESLYIRIGLVWE